MPPVGIEPTISAGERPQADHLLKFRLSAKGANPFKSAKASVQSTTGSRGVRISGSNAGYTNFRDSVKSTGYPLHSPVSPSGSKAILIHQCLPMYILVL